MRSWRKGLISASALVLSCALFACSLITPRDGSQLKRATVGELTALLVQRQSAMQTMKGLFSAKITGGLLPIGQRVEGTVLYRRPDAIRLRGFTPLGGELFEFVQIADEYRLRLPTLGRVLNGYSSETQASDKLGRAFRLSVWAMSGVIGTEAIGSAERVRLEEEGDRYRLDVYAGDRDQATGKDTPLRRIWFDRRLFMVVAEERLASNGETDITMQFDDFRPVGPSEGSTTAVSDETPQQDRLLRPFKVSLKDGQGHGTVQITFHEIIANVPIQPAELGRV